MTAIVTNKFPVLTAKSVKTYLSTGVCYLGIGKNTVWPDESQPSIPDYTSHSTDHSDILAIKKILSTNVSLVVPRIDWTSGNTYIANQSYIMTDEYKVYLCKTASGTSLVKPTGTDLSNPETAGTYTWQYLYTIEINELVNFLTNSWLPVYEYRSSVGLSVPTLDSYDPAKTLNARYVLISIVLNDTEGGDFSNTTTYRKVLVLDSPKLSNGTTACTATTYNSSEIFTGSGSIIYKDYRKYVQREATQKENINIILEF